MKPNRVWNVIMRLFGRAGKGGGPPAAPMDPEMLKGMVRMILSTREDEIDCGRCFDLLDEYVDLVLSGRDASEAMPLVQHHLEHCADCREEFEALLMALSGRAPV